MIIETTIKEFVEVVSKAFPGYEFRIQALSRGQYRVFVLQAGVSLGRLTFRPEPEGLYLFAVKNYGQNHPYSPAQDFFFQFPHWCATANILDIPALILEARELKSRKVSAQLEWRRQNPLQDRPDGTPRKRKRISEAWFPTFKALIQSIEGWFYDKDEENDLLS